MTMKIILIDSDCPKDHDQARVLNGRTIVGVEFPQVLEGDGGRWKHLILLLDDGTVVDVCGQGSETACVDVRIEMPNT